MSDYHTIDSEESSKPLWFWVIALLVVVAWAATWFLLRNEPNRGTFGDMFGAVNALFSGFAFAGVIYAILLQQNELRLQRKELSLTREELQGGRKAQEYQAETLAVTAELNVLNTLIQDSILKENRLSEMAKQGTYNIGGVATETLIEQAQTERADYISRMRKMVRYSES